MHWLLIVIISIICVGLFYLLVKKAIQEGVNNAGHLKGIQQQLKEIKEVLESINNKTK